MNTINYMITNESVIVNYEGRTEAVSSSDARFEKILTAIKENRLSDIPAIVEENERLFTGRLSLVDGLVHVDSQPLPFELSARILAFKEQGLPFDALVKFWDNLKLNSSFNARKMLFQFLEHNGHPLTQDGEFIAYRGVTNEFTDLHTGKFDNSPGKVCQVDRSEVDDNPNNTCSNGLHVACFNYAKDFGPKLIEVKVNPADVVCVPVDYNGTKMRVCKFEVIQECANIRTEQLYEAPKSITYEELNDSEFDNEEEEIEICEECGDDVEPGNTLCYDCVDSE